MNLMSECAICGLFSEEGLDHEDCFLSGTISADSPVLE